MRIRLAATAALLVTTAIPALASTPVAAGAPPAVAYAVVRDPSDTDGYFVEGKDVFNSAIGRVRATNTEPGSVEVRFSSWPDATTNVLVTPLTTKPRFCSVGGQSTDGLSLRVYVDCYNRDGVPTDTPFIVTLRGLRAGHGHVAYLWADAPGLAGYIPADAFQMNGTDPSPVNAVAKIDTGLWVARLQDLAATAGTVQVSPAGGVGTRCGAVRWEQDGDDELVRVRCRDLSGDPTDQRFVLWYAKGQGLASGLDRKQVYLFAHRPKAASYTPKFRFSTEGGTPTVTRVAKGRWTVTLPNMAKGGAAIATPIGDGGARCNVSSIRKNALPQKVGVRCWNPAGQPASAKFTLAYVR